MLSGGRAGLRGRKLTAFGRNTPSSGPKDTVCFLRTHRLPEDLPVIPQKKGRVATLPFYLILNWIYCMYLVYKDNIFWSWKQVFYLFFRAVVHKSLYGFRIISASSHRPYLACSEESEYQNGDIERFRIESRRKPVLYHGYKNFAQRTDSGLQTSEGEEQDDAQYCADRSPYLDQPVVSSR